MFSGILQLNNPSNSNISFENLYINPNVNAEWHGNTLSFTTFRGCRLDSNSHNSYIGNMNIEGCYSENLTTPTSFAPFHDITIKNVDSFWLNGPRTSFNNIAKVNFLNMTNCQDPDYTLYSSAVNLSLYSINITSTSSSYVFNLGAYYTTTILNGICNVTALNIENNNVSNSFLVAVADGPQTLVIDGARLVNNANSGSCVLVALGASVVFTTSYSGEFFPVNISSNQAAFVVFMGGEIIIDNGDVTATTNGNTGLCALSENSRLIIRPRAGDSLTFSMPNAGNTALIIVSQNSIFDINLDGSGSTINFSANTTGPVVAVNDHSTFIITGFSGTTFNIINTNPNGYGVRCVRKSNYVATTGTTIAYSTNQISLNRATLVLNSGSSGQSTQPISDSTASRLLITGNVAAVAGPGSFNTSQNDYALIPTQNCSMTFG